MDSRHSFGYGVTGAQLSCSSYPAVLPIPDSLFESLKFDSLDPYSSSFSTLSEPLTPLSNIQDQHSSTDNPSVGSHSCSSPLETTSYFQQLSPSSLECYQNPPLLHFEGGSFFQTANVSQNIKYTLQELETALMENEEEEEVIATPYPSFGGNNRPKTAGQRSMAWNQELQVSNTTVSQPSHSYDKSAGRFQTEKHYEAMEETSLQGKPPDDLKQLLIACAKALSENKLEDFEKLIEKARSAVSVSGEPIQRLGAYMIEGLVARKELSGSYIYRSLKCREQPEGKDLLSYMHILYEICPYLKFGYMAANGAIAEACKNEDCIHIIDYQICQGTQWMTLLQALAARPSGPPRVRITGIDDPASQYARGSGLEAVGMRLEAISEKFNIPVEFHPLPVFASEVTREMLSVRPGEAVVVNFPLQLHHTPDESVDVTNPRDGLLRMVKSLSPKVVTLVEQESNTNTAPFVARFIEALDYYSAMFESIDVALPRDQKERINAEMHCLARDIVNVVACEGRERVERHELLGKWKSRFTMAGFRQFPLSSYVNSAIGGLLKGYCEHYTLVEKDGAMLLGWKDRNLVSVSAWC
ncbi:hypothetical protein RHSIM_RhsimUnG0254300 [Rhododendron simsii]|uniref:Uncharacterized protein n=1 Tax=Rhododendron simsii TaxID=118357 RepID=A0A834L1X8_RHOSS|nr:hypothetical protein RHSIM_RhsimUnG0254300 [Rhododendron simsii]